ncbi:hypothetical protein GGH97_002072 [Coemansia sp. RSA 475]|nr:hypothetical protein GGH97_002072 [Coemansia sp. RSA 475]
MVPNRHQFCYRFYLSGAKMQWQARKCGRNVIELQCFVRSSVIALLLFGGYSLEDAPRPEDKRRWWSENCACSHRVGCSAINRDSTGGI